MMFRMEHRLVFEILSSVVSILLLCGASDSLLQPSASIEEICRTKVNTQRRQSYLKGLHGISTSLTAIAYDIGRHGLPQVKNIVTKRCNIGSGRSEVELFGECLPSERSVQYTFNVDQILNCSYNNLRKAEYFIDIIKNQTSLQEVGCITQADSQHMTAIFDTIHNLRIDLSYQLCLSGIMVEDESQHATLINSYNIQPITYSNILKQVLRNFRMLRKDLNNTAYFILKIIDL